jgi:hypothetical protein
MNNEEILTRIYNEANGITEGKNPPITTERIFVAMQAAYNKAIEAAINDYYLQAAGRHIAKRLKALELK